MMLGIVPDYIIESDANERTVYHLRNCENSEIPMLLLSTANCHFMEKYKGKKYLVFQKDYEKVKYIVSLTKGIYTRQVVL